MYFQETHSSSQFLSTPWTCLESAMVIVESLKMMVLRVNVTERLVKKRQVVGAISTAGEAG